MATANAYIICRARNMTIKNGNLSKKLLVYPSHQPSIKHDLHLWVEDEEEDEWYHTTPYPIFNLYIVIVCAKLDEHQIIDHIL